LRRTIFPWEKEALRRNAKLLAILLVFAFQLLLIRPACSAFGTLDKVIVSASYSVVAGQLANVDAEVFTLTSG
jgi:hypothetical protein